MQLNSQAVNFYSFISLPPTFQILALRRQSTADDFNIYLFLGSSVLLSRRSAGYGRKMPLELYEKWRVV